MVLDFLLPRSDLDKQISDVTPEELLEKIVHNTKELEEEVLALFDYRDELIRHMIWSLKYKRNQHVARVFGHVLYTYLVEELGDRVLFSDFTDPLLLPIPLSNKRQRERGFNQVEWLAEELIAISGDSFCTLSTDTLKRIKHTKSQTSLKNKNERKQNVREAFAVSDPEKVRDRSIILLDDVITTDATMAEARRTLLKAGARQVLCVAVAH